jgi:hypothetical protein
VEFDDPSVLTQTRRTTRMRLQIRGFDKILEPWGSLIAGARA